MELTAKVERFATVGVSLATAFILIYASVKLRHRTFERFQKEGIEIPFPQRTVHLRKEGN